MAQGQDAQGKPIGPLSFEEVVDEELEVIVLRRKSLGDAGATPQRTKRDLSALCLSGGGVRSASFCLGFMRALAAQDNGLLKRFDYLSTVSGGGFAGSFVTRLVTNLCTSNSGGYAKAEKILAAEMALQSVGNQGAVPPLANLKENISYLTPRMGITSLDSLAGVGLYTRNLLLNWLILIPCLLTVVYLILGIFELACIAAYMPADIDLAFIRLALPVLGLTLAGWSFAESLAARPGWSTKGNRSLVNFFLVKGIPQSIAALCLAFSALLSGAAWSQISLAQVCGLGAVLSILAYLQAVYWLTASPVQTERKSKELLLLWFLAVVAQGIVAAIVAFGLGKFLVNLVPHSKIYQSQLLIAFAPLLLAIGNFVGETIYVAMTSWTMEGEVEREWLARNTAAQFRLPIAWLALSLPIVIAPQLLGDEVKGFFSTLFGGSKEASLTVVTTLAGFIVVQLGRAKEIWSLAKQGTETFKTWTQRQILLLALPVFIFGLATVLSLMAHALAGMVLRSSDSDNPALRRLLEIAQDLWPWIPAILVFPAYVFLAFLCIGRSRSARKVSRLMRKAWRISLFGIGFFVLAFVVSVALRNALAFSHTQAGSKWVLFMALATVFAGFAWFADYLVETNKFSLHAIYRNRIIKTFLGAANLKMPGFSMALVDANNANQRLEMEDNISLSLIGDVLKNTKKLSLKQRAQAVPPQVHVLGFSMNVPNSKSLAAQERKALPFTASPLFVGSRSIQSPGAKSSSPGSYRRSEDYAKYPSEGWQVGNISWLAWMPEWSSLKPQAIRDSRPLTLGTATAISGAAVNSNMGYHSSPALSVLLAAFNVRLGVWLGNTNSRGEITHTLDGPSSALKCFFLEAFGLANEDRKFVLLTDGGHFDNLAAYEMIARKCKTIVIIDAGADPKPAFADLGVLERLVYLDLGTLVRFKASDMEKMLARKLAVMEGEVDYGPDFPTGRLIYVKPTALPEFLTPSAKAYHLANEQFPNETTVDQWFNESQFNAYFQLGEQIGRHVTRRFLANAMKAPGS